MAKNIFKKRFSFFVIGSLLMTANSIASPVELKGHIAVTNAMPANVILHSYADESFSASANVAKDGTFSFIVDMSGTMLYNIRIMRASYDVMLSAKEKIINVDIELDNGQLKTISAVNSPENDAYKAFNVIVTLYDNKLRSHFVDCDEGDTCERNLHGLLLEFQHELITVKDNFKGTYTSDVLCPIRMPVQAKNIKNTSAEFRKGFFENVPFADSTIFNTPVYKDMINDYADFLTGSSITRENEFVKEYTAKIKSNPLVLHKSAGLLFEDLYTQKKEKMLAMFIAWYNTGDNKGTINNPVLDVKLNAVSKVMPGQLFTDATGLDTAAMLRSLKDVVSKSKCTLLIFWSSECSHCREEMPSIQEYYKKYHAKGFNIYAVTLESNTDKWKAFIKEKNLNWTNVMIAQADDPNAARQYVVTATPTLVLIDNSGVILHRFISKGRLEADIAEALK